MNVDLLAHELVTGPWRYPLMCVRAALAGGSHRVDPVVETLVHDVLARFPEPPAHDELVDYLVERGEQPARTHQPARVELASLELGLRLPDRGAVERLLAVDSGELDWLADLQSRERRAPAPLRHYRWTALPKRDGVRLLAAPKPRLKEAQRRLLRGLIGRIPLHDAAHGAVPGRSVRSTLAPHADAAVIVRMDLANFFPTITAPRVAGVLESVGVTAEVARIVAGLCTTVVPVQVWRELVPPGVGDQHRLRMLLREPHLPQGAPTSPALANAVLYRLDRRIAALAASFGGRYTRYVDDLVIGGDRRLPRAAVIAAVTEVVRSEGFAVAPGKTVVLPGHRRQALLGAVINERPALPRWRRDQLRAIVHNCVVHGPESQHWSRDALLGHVSAAGAIDPVFGGRLRAEFDRIVWP